LGLAKGKYGSLKKFLLKFTKIVYSIQVDIYETAYPKAITNDYIYNLVSLVKLPINTVVSI